MNDGKDVFVIRNGAVGMYHRAGGREDVKRMAVQDIGYASNGTGHVAHPPGDAPVPVIEREGSE